MPFEQTPPKLGNQYEDDRVLRSYLERVLPAAMLREIEGPLAEMGRLAGDELYELQLADRLNEESLAAFRRAVKGSPALHLLPSITPRIGLHGFQINPI